MQKFRIIGIISGRKATIACEIFPTSSERAEMQQHISYIYKFALKKEGNLPKVGEAKICKVDSKVYGSRQCSQCLEIQKQDRKLR